MGPTTTKPSSPFSLSTATRWATVSCKSRSKRPDLPPDALPKLKQQFNPPETKKKKKKKKVLQDNITDADITDHSRSRILFIIFVRKLKQNFIHSFSYLPPPPPRPFLTSFS